MRPQFDREVAVERRRDLEERVDPRRPPTAFEPRDRRLRRPAALRELGLGEPERLAPLHDLTRDLGEQPAVLGAGDALADPLDGGSALDS